MARRRSNRIYLMRGRYYGDFRDFANVDGKREALRPQGQRQATDDLDVATQLASDRPKELKAAREAKAQGVTANVFGIVPRATLRPGAHRLRANCRRKKPSFCGGPRHRRLIPPNSLGHR